MARVSDEQRAANDYRWARQVSALLLIAVVVLVAAGLLVRSLVRLENVDPGIRADGALTVSLLTPPDLEAATARWPYVRGTNRTPSCSRAADALPSHRADSGAGLAPRPCRRSTASARRGRPKRVLGDATDLFQVLTQHLELFHAGDNLAAVDFHVEAGEIVERRGFEPRAAANVEAGVVPGADDGGARKHAVGEGGALDLIGRGGGAPEEGGGEERVGHRNGGRDAKR